MNIEKLARHLKEFTLDEIEMIAECDCKTELERLLNEGKLVFEQELYKYQSRNLSFMQNKWQIIRLLQLVLRLIIF